MNTRILQFCSEDPRTWVALATWAARRVQARRLCGRAPELQHQSYCYSATSGELSELPNPPFVSLRATLRVK